jgi:hypothetical protein
MWGSAIMRDFTVTAKVIENTSTRVSLREYYEYFFLFKKDVFNAIWYGGLLAQQLAIDIAIQMLEHTMEFYKSSEQQEIKLQRDFFKALTDYCNTKVQRQASSRDKIVNFTFKSISSYRRSSTMGFTSYTVRDEMTRNEITPRRNNPATK